MTDYRQSKAYVRSQRYRPDGRPVWPLTADDLVGLLKTPDVRVRQEGRR